MIPKKVHYCWFGKGPLPKLAIKCLASWSKYLPDYEMKLWNEDSFDVNTCNYTLEAYQEKKYAFVTDYVRLFALYSEGGIYMDTDVEVLKNLDFFLDLPAFSGFEGYNHVPTGIMASEANGLWVKEQLAYYKDRHFKISDGSLDTTTNVKIISGNMSHGGFQFNNTFQNYKNLITIFPNDFFCPKSYDTGKINLTQNTYCIHHFAESWVPRSRKIRKKLIRFFGEKNIHLLVRFKMKFLNAVIN